MLLLRIFGKLGKFNDSLFVTILIVLDEKAQGQTITHALFEFIFCEFSHQGVGVVFQCTDGPPSNVDIVMLT